ncbi:MAG: molybdenum cofactor guanylyltransferase [Gammaproteobacteria bacterium]|nr:MAG: molybdenum cofactor guanylyltransferase [Gammaproteobacteria bacterium]
MQIPTHSITGLILAGGRSRRMGGRDKGLMPLPNGRLMVEAVSQALRPQVGPLLISANRNRSAYLPWGDEVLRDLRPEHPGPLAGIEAGLMAARTPWVLVAPCDAPALPSDLGQRLAAGIGDAPAAVLHDGKSLQPLFALLQPAHALPITRRLLDEDRPRVMDWARALEATVVDAADIAPALANLNDPEALEKFHGRD